jgi:hypothetical protein
MQTADIVEVLTDMNVGHVVDCGNPDYTVLLDNGGMVDTLDYEEGAVWTVLSLDRKFAERVSTPDELRAVIKELLAR